MLLTNAARKCCSQTLLSYTANKLFNSSFLKTYVRQNKFHDHTIYNGNKQRKKIYVFRKFFSK